MKKRMLMVVVFAVLVASLFAMALVSCSSSSSDSPPPPSVTTGKIIGKVSNSGSGAAISGAAVTDGTASTTTAADGTYTLDNLAATSRKVLTISAANFAFTSKITAVNAGVTSRVDVSLLPVTYAPTLSTQTSGTTLTVPGSSAQVELAANSLVTASGGAPAFPVTANITPLDPSSNPQLMPGDFTVSSGVLIESFGAMEVSFKDSTGAALNLASGSTSTIRIPVAAATTAPLATMDMYYFNTTTGLWVKEGTLTLGGTAPNQYYEGSVTHFTYWNADMAYSTTCITGRVVNSAGTPVANARVETQGRDYVGTATAYTGADGTFTILAKANSEVIVSASTSDTLSNSVVVFTGAAGSVCTALPGDLTLGAVIGSAGSGSAKIKLTWGLDPSDLDSHLTGPDAATPGTRFHVYYSSQGSQTVSPFAELDVDDTSSFGPEVITISRFTAGTYRYSVHHYSGLGTIYTSPARVELTLNGSTTVYTPPAAGSDTIGVDSVWQVFELVIDASGNATVNTLNTYVLNVPASAVTAPVFKGAPKPAVHGGNW
jgi:hypothetical protein